MLKKLVIIIFLGVFPFVTAMADPRGTDFEFVEVVAELEIKYHEKFGLLVFDIFFQNTTEKTICIQEFDFNYDNNNISRFFTVKTQKGNELNFLGKDYSREEIGFMPHTIKELFYVVPPQRFMGNDFKVYHQNDDYPPLSLYQFFKGTHEYEVSFQLEGYFCEDFNNYGGDYHEGEYWSLRKVKIKSPPVKFTFTYPPSEE